MSSYVIMTQDDSEVKKKEYGRAKYKGQSRSLKKLIEAIYPLDITSKIISSLTKWQNVGPNGFVVFVDDERWRIAGGWRLSKISWIAGH